MYIISKVKMFSNYVERKHQSTYVTHIQTHSYSRRICIIISVIIVTRDQFIQRRGWMTFMIKMLIIIIITVQLNIIE